MNQSLISTWIVLNFSEDHKTAIDEFLVDKQDKPILRYDERDNRVSLFFNRAKVFDFDAWLAETLELLDYQNNKAFYQLSDVRVLSFYTAPDFTMETINISVTADQLSLFCELNLSMDWNYGPGFNPDLLGTYHPASSTDYETGWSVRHPKNRNNAMKWGSIPIW